MRPIGDLLKHGAVYGVGQILGRMASVLLLPLYTRFVGPEDYGVIAILDVVAGLLAILVGSGMASAVNRFHFDVETDDQRRAVWWTGLVFVALASTAVVAPLWLVGDTLAWMILGPEVAHGGRLVALSLATLWVNSIGLLPDTYLRVRKWSGLAVVVSLGRLCLNVGLNVWWLVFLGWGVEGVLWGNFATAVVTTLALLAIQAANTGRFRFDGGLLREMLHFGMPLVVTALLSMALHDADRFLLRAFAGMAEVGVYSVAYKIGQSVGTLVLTPFATIWAVSMYEIAALPNPRRVFARVFDRYVEVLSVIMLAASLFAEPILSVLVPDSYGGAADLVPIICLAYLLFALHQHFQVPVMLRKQTRQLVPVFVTATLVNVLANVALIPVLGAAGAAWATVVGFATFSFGGLLVYRQLDRIPYDLPAFARLVVAMCAVYVAVVTLRTGDLITDAATAAFALIAWTVVLFGRDAIRMWSRFRRRQTRNRVYTDPECDRTSSISSSTSQETAQKRTPESRRELVTPTAGETR